MCAEKNFGLENLWELNHPPIWEWKKFFFQRICSRLLSGQWRGASHFMSLSFPFSFWERPFWWFSANLGVSENIQTRVFCAWTFFSAWVFELFSWLSGYLAYEFFFRLVQSISTLRKCTDELTQWEYIV